MQNTIAKERMPQPNAEQITHSQALRALIASEIAAAGSVPFSHYMNLALYAPGLGYYTAGARKFGEAGDFITSPEVSALFGMCLANAIASILVEMGGGDILELGAGSGALARDVLAALTRLERLPGHYLILEPSPDLCARQQQCLAALPAEQAARVVWLDSLPKDFRGVILANEVADALAVERFRIGAAGVEQLHVTQRNNDFTEIFQPAPMHLTDAVAALRQTLAAPLPAGYISEVCLQLPAWSAALAEPLQQGAILIIDYGYPRREYYLPERHGGTLICHYRHRGHTDPYWYPGLQDISAFVDFTALVAAMHAAGLDFEGYTSQTQFLLQTGLSEALKVVAVGADSITCLKFAQQAKTLTLPGEMGERFKVAGFSRGLHDPVPGFLINHNHSL